ncbi:MULTISPECIES: gephyrin-like molybdotransferase Glp [unclassified Undibacterium]|uniref:molybdopterin molybdotransferase MoeA n=1 Tax=unclassified Undibacterium TaxID=2630295 RepID=UPI002AC9B21B|nr:MULTISPECIES: gephyrin-like molybdotransferase Glp [unclassified Undibacterium]MEB0140678.1 molybdopterin molybdotransferase MoeA [Undibacterium sp. CCC2.1]MEB0173706.1 molybdopterin molybdotransferase MoeA [Undibacterium sp. CCC1.1]MEB0177662.1 molybdopterin molybdotransferase MoeA [Undibacterium sp. CCC3.4]MEB0216873.1 molybdopterin molybdotransferase MoeA [Undibacterium sp. 5I2]WPX43372.1 molybdopterin molybdotransferase MoeA [Undibacterium sp. CCC3.4]
MTEKKPLLSVDQALALLLAAVRPLTQSETIATLDAAGRVLAQAQTSLLDVPSLDNTQMDGYAVRAADCQSAEARLPVTQRIAAGQLGQPLQPGTAARIFTGALIPPGADAVLMQEQCVADGTDVIIGHVPQSGDWIRRRGEDIAAGASILAAGTVLRAQHLGLAASVGLATLPVLRQPRVAVFFTGDELTMPGEALKPGAIYNSNRYTLTALLRGAGCLISDFGIVPDTLEATRATLRAAAQGNDLIITSGGVSVGEEDHIKPAVEAEGSLNMWQIAVKPGKPLAFGEVGESFFLGLPGNPVSSFVTFLLFVRPFLLRMQGVTDVTPQAFSLRADFTWAKPDRRREFLRARINADGGLDLFANQSSGVLTSTVWGDGLVDVPAGQSIAAGEMVRFLPFSSF